MQAFCASFCMVHQAALLYGNVVYSTSLPMYPYSLLPPIQSQQSTAFVDQQAEQQYLAKMEQISANEENKIQHSSVCLYLCQNNYKSQQQLLLPPPPPSSLLLSLLSSQQHQQQQYES
uniref:Uncharacterized protein n=1 Tax=Wuchereria bancrofti TaxID=6293 RepID=A0AAF5Q3V3_WUCBA